MRRQTLRQPRAPRLMLEVLESRLAPAGAGNPGVDAPLASPSSAVTSVFGLAYHSAGYNDPRGITTDSAGYIYVTGRFGGTVNFDPLGPANVHTAAGITDIYVAKYTPQGHLVWLDDFGCSEGWGVGAGIGVDGHGNVYVTGYIQIMMNVGRFSLETIDGSKDVFVAKLDSSGNALWAKDFGGPGVDLAYDLKVDRAGDVFIGGWFFDTTSFGKIKLTSKGERDGFVARLDTNGTVQWATGVGGSLDDSVNAIAVDRAGNVYANGWVQGKASFGNVTLTSHGQTDIFVCKLDPKGQVVWADDMGGAKEDTGYGMVVNPAGTAIFGTANFSGTASFGHFTLTAQGPQGGNANTDAVVFRLNSSGTVQWVKALGGPLDDGGTDLQLDPHGNLYAVGFFRDTVTFGTPHLKSEGGYDTWLAKLTPSGRVEWAWSLDGADKDVPSHVALDPSGGIEIIGVTTSPTLTASSGDLTIAASSGQTNTFLVRVMPRASMGTGKPGKASSSAGEIQAHVHASVS